MSIHFCVSKNVGRCQIISIGNKFRPKVSGIIYIIDFSPTGAHVFTNSINTHLGSFKVKFKTIQNYVVYTYLLVVLSSCVPLLIYDILFVPHIVTFAYIP